MAGPTRQRRTVSGLLLALLAVLAVLAHARALQVVERLQDPPPAAHRCARPCEPGVTMTCHYEFWVESYHSMSKACYNCPWNATDCARPDCIAADGVKRALVVVNRQLPGPGLHLCAGDRVEVTVRNAMQEQSTSVHWHGLQQRGTPYMDGVPFVTQCPIQTHAAFRYSFRADNPGTHFWHSHSGCQRADGAVGAFTVRLPRAQDPHAALYDEDLPEHAILLWDWTHTPAASKFLAHHHAGDDNKADAVLINGKGTTRRFVAADGTAVTAPREVFSVRKGLRYRFRIVNAGFLNCPLELSVDNHTLLVIASDGFDIKPKRVDSLVSYAGERWDVVVEADQPAASYWLRVHGLLDCGPRRAHEAAVLRYEGADPALEPAGPPPSYDVFANGTGRQVNSLNRGSADNATTSAAELQALPDDRAGPTADPALKPEADVKLFVSYDFYAVDNPHIHRAGLYGIHQVSPSPHRVFTPQLNHISLNLPAFPLLSGRDRLGALGDGHGLCNQSSLLAQGRDCDREYCECTHVVRVPLGGVLEIILVDQGVRYDANHPFHLHGHSFRVVALEKLGTSTTVERVRQLDEEGRLARNLVDPPSKDTVTVPDGGYTVLRVHADNPGYWLFHCHIEFHVELGMALVVKVGEHEDMPPVPRNFPQCGDWDSSSWQDDEDVGDNHIPGAPQASPSARAVSSPPPSSTTPSSTARPEDEAPTTEAPTTEAPESAETATATVEDGGGPLGLSTESFPLHPTDPGELDPLDAATVPTGSSGEGEDADTAPTALATSNEAPSPDAVAEPSIVSVSTWIMHVNSSSSSPSGHRRTLVSEKVSVTEQSWDDGNSAERLGEGVAAPGPPAALPELNDNVLSPMGPGAGASRPAHRPRGPQTPAPPRLPAAPAAPRSTSTPAAPVAARVGSVAAWSGPARASLLLTALLCLLRA